MTVTLRDGSRVTIRPLEPDDRGALVDAFERLSPESRYRRFFAPMNTLSERDLAYLTELDHHDHEAVVAEAADTREGIGVARYVRTGPDTAEPAIVVVDDWQGRGVGSRLLDALVERARAEGVRRFEAPVLASNPEAIHLLSQLGQTTRRPEGREVHLTIELPDGPGATVRWRHALREFASGTLQPARTVLELLFPRRRGAPGDERRNVIVVGTDGSEHAELAVEAAAELAAALQATVDVVGAHRLLAVDQRDVTSAVRAAAGAMRERGLHVHEQLRRGEPALVLTEAALECSARLIVVGAGHRGKTARRLLGSTADLVAERSPCNVLIVRPREEAA